MKQNKILLMLLAALLMPLAVAAQALNTDAKYVLVVSGNSVDSETAASTWFTDTYGSQGQVLTVSQLSDYTLNPSKQKAVWVHLDQGKDVTPSFSAFSGEPTNKLRNYVEAGGSLLLTLHAAGLAAEIGRIDSKYTPNNYSYHGGTYDAVGLNTNLGNTYNHSSHPVFAGLKGSDYKFPLVTGESSGLHESIFDFNNYEGAQADPNKLVDYENKNHATVLATWTNVTDFALGTVIEFPAYGEYSGCVLAISAGAYAWDSNNKYSSDGVVNIEKLTQNALGYLKDKTNEIVAPSGETIDEKYVMVVSDGFANIAAEDNARSWFVTKYGPDGAVITASEVEDYNLDPKKNKAVWVHFNQAPTVSSNGVAVLKGYMQNGGNLLLTKYASDLLADMDRIGTDYKANLTGHHTDGGKGGGLNVNINNGAANTNGNYLHSSHPAFKGLLSGSAVTFDLVANGYRDGIVMEHGWDFNNITGKLNTPNVLVDYEAKTNSIVLSTWTGITDVAVGGMIEYLPQGDYDGSRTAFQGRAIAIGAGCYAWNAPDLSTTGTAVNIQTLTDNCLTYLESCTNRQLRKETYVAYLLPQDLTDGFDEADALAAVDQDDEKTALTWFYDELVKTGKGKVICPKDLADLDPSYITTTWVHIDRDGDSKALISNWSAAANDNALGQENMRALLARYVENGGNLLLTKHAVQLVNKNSDGGFFRSDVSVTSETGSTFEEDKGPWAINAVIGAGFNGDEFILGDPSRANGDAYDHRKHHLYYNMTKDNTTYPDEPNEVWHWDTMTPYSYTGGKHYDVFQIIGRGNNENHNCMWREGINVTNFQNANYCTVLGTWGHLAVNWNAAIVDFEPCTEYTTADSWRLGRTWEGHILCIGLGAYEWQQNDKDDKPIANPYLPNIKQLTYNALNVLENPITDETVQFTVGGVTYLGISSAVDGDHATIIDAVSTLGKYDLVGTTGSNPVNGEVTDPATGGKTYTINSIGLGAFMKCTDLAYADIMDFGATITSNPRAGSFPEHTLIYLPASCEVTGQNLVNTDETDETKKTCVDLKVFDKKYWANKYAFTTRKMSYDRSYSDEAAAAGKYKTTVALPFPIDATHAAEFGSFYKFNGVKDGSANYKLVASTTAYEPYMFMPKKNAIAYESEDDVTIPALDQDEWVATSSTDGGEFVARYREFTFEPHANNYTYEGGTKAYTIYAYYKDPDKYNTLLTTSKTIHVNPFRVYLRIENSSNPARMLLMVFDDSEDQPTEIDGITTQPVLGSQPVYDLSGRRIQLGADLSRLTRGIYIIGGRKVVIK